MNYPDTIERKLGFDQLRTLLKGRCISSLGTEWVDDKLTFSGDYKQVKLRLERAHEMSVYLDVDGEAFDLGIYDVREALARIRPERTQMEELEMFHLCKSMQTAAALVKAFRSPGEDGTQLNALCEMCQNVSLHPELVRQIRDVLSEFGKVKDTASSELLTIRHNLEVQVRGISHSLRAIIQSAQSEGLIERDVTPTLRDGRLVIPVAPALKRRIKGIVHDESASGKTVFIEPQVVVEANNRIRELRAAEKREVARILTELTSALRPHLADLQAIQVYLGEMDCLRAISLLSDAWEAQVPALCEQPLMGLKAAVHPLLRQSLARSGRQAVPLDITLSKEQRLLVISGPNAGGKSVCLKTAGLLQYMLQCGMPIPVAEESKAGVFSELFVDIGDEQSIENDLSTYSGHLAAMKEMMKRGTSKSLLLIDEFGSGTEPQIGGALAEGILHHFVGQGVMGIITTHYHNLKHYAQQTPGVVNGAMLYDRGQMRPLFVLQIGNPGSSFAVEIARNIGLPEEVIRYAEGLVGHDYIMSDKYLQDIVRDKMYWERKRRNIHLREKQLEETTRRYEAQVEDVASRRKEVLEQARTQAKEIIRASNAQIENTIRTIKETQAKRDETREARARLASFVGQLEKRAADEAARRKQDDIDRAAEKIRRRQQRRMQGEKAPRTSTVEQHAQTAMLPPPALADSIIHPDMYVRIKGQDSVGRVVSISGGKAQVLYGSIYATTKIDRLEPCDKPKTDVPAAGVAATFVSRQTRDAMHETKLLFKPELDMRGLRADEALRPLSRFIDDALLCEQTRVRILHGTGTGALRTLVRQYLSTVPQVKDYRDEHPQFGGAGVTIAMLE